MDRRHGSRPALPREWQPLVSSRQWAGLADAYLDTPEVLDDLRIVLSELSPRGRGVLIDNLMDVLASETRPTRALWDALALTGHELKLCSAEKLGRLHALADDVPDGVVHPLRPKE